MHATLPLHSYALRAEGRLAVRVEHRLDSNPGRNTVKPLYRHTMRNLIALYYLSEARFNFAWLVISLFSVSTLSGSEIYRPMFGR